MNINELDQYRLSDAVKFHNRLNPHLWDKSEQLRPEVRDALLKISEDFQESLGVQEIDLLDITISGSNAAYSYTPHSDIDLHLVVKMPEQDGEIYQELFNAKKYQYNDEHNIRIRGADVELYVQPSTQPHVSQGIYSVKNNKWVRVPSRRRAKVDDTCVLAKTEDLEQRINTAVKSNDSARLDSLWNKIKEMRKSGLQKTGEFGCENLTFKMLRRSGALEKIEAARKAIRDKELSLVEKKKEFVKYGYGSVDEDNTDMAQGSEIGDNGAQSTWDGVSPSTQEFLNEKPESKSLTVDDFKVNAFESLNSYKHWQQSPKTGKRGATRYHAAKYAGMFVDSKLVESNDVFAQRKKEAKQFSQAFKKLDQRSDVKIAIGTSLSLLSSTVVPGDDSHKSRIELSGFVNPKKIVKLNLDIDDKIDSIEFSDGTQFPEAAEFTTVGGINITNTIFFSKEAAAKQAFTHIWMLISNLEGSGWSIEKYLTESTQDVSHIEDTLTHFIQNVTKRLGIKRMPQVSLHRDAAWSESAHSFGRYEPESHTLHVSLPNRHILDIMRTVAHELAHCRQQEISPLPSHAGATGSKWENEANAMAGKIMRDFAGTNPEYFETGEVHESSGYIPTAAEKNDPRFIMALSPDVQPGETGRQANKLNLETDSQGRPALLTQKYLSENQILDEVNMSPTMLRQTAAAIDATAGMEFEMIVPGVGGDDEEAELDYDQDVPVRSIYQISEFFSVNDHNSRQMVERFTNKLMEQYQEAWYEAMSESWEKEYHDLILEKIMDEHPEKEAVDQRLKEKYSDEEVAEILAVVASTPESIRSVRGRGEDTYVITHPLYGKYLKTFDEVDDEYDSTVEKSYKKQDRYYTDALDEFQNDWDGLSEQAWLHDQGIRRMSDVADSSDLTWPHWTTPDLDIDAIADDFRKIVSYKVVVSPNYKGVSRGDYFIIEPDQSIDPDSNDTNARGLEFITPTPPLPLDKMLTDLNKIVAWAKESGFKTNETTGLHMNVSLPGFSKEDKSNLDYVKLALLLGDEYVLNQFGRIANTYTNSAMKKIRNRITQSPNEITKYFDLMRKGLALHASNIIHSPDTQKYTSINVKDGYIEFRSPGGDWLNEDIKKLENTLLRFVVALDAAVSHDKYRDEYLKKLYKILAPKNEQDPIAIFAKWSAGELPQSALKSFIKRIQAQRAEKKTPPSESPVEQGRNYKIFKDTNSNVLFRFQASTPEEARAKFDDWIVGNGGQRGGYGYSVVDPRAERVWDPVGAWAATQHATNDLSSDTPTWQRNREPVPSSTQDIQNQRAAGRFTGAWEVRDANDNVVYTFSGVGNSQSDANRVASEWVARTHPDLPPGDISVLPVMSNS